MTEIYFFDSDMFCVGAYDSDRYFRLSRETWSYPKAYRKDQYRKAYRII